MQSQPQNQSHIGKRRSCSRSVEYVTIQAQCRRLVQHHVPVDDSSAAHRHIEKYQEGNAGIRIYPLSYAKRELLAYSAPLWQRRYC